MLSGRCNLSCAYCYLDRRQVQGAMNWGTITTALNSALSLGQEELGVEFTGGEPLLEVTLLERAVEFVERHRAPDTKVEFSLTTSKTFLTPAILVPVAHGPRSGWLPAFRRPRPAGPRDFSGPGPPAGHTADGLPTHLRKRSQ
jgi:hypothetical protein